MHIAICDDNIADRKQLERLLKRESEKRSHAFGVFYADSFGDSEILRRKAMQYSLIFIDMTDGNCDGFELALSLIHSGISAPIVLCSSKINYLERINTLDVCPVNLMHLNKAIKTSELSEVIDTAIQMQSLREPTIELRSETDTYYVKEDEIIYASQKGNYVHVTLTDGKTIPILTAMDNFYDQISMYTHFVRINTYGLFNIAYMKECSLFKVILKDGTELKSTPFAARHIKNVLHTYQEEKHSASQ